MTLKDVGARDEHGVVHSCDRYPAQHPSVVGRASGAGFTWCMIFFTWADGPRFHEPNDPVEARLERVESHTTCLECIASETL